MKMPLCVSVAILAGVLNVEAQNQKTNNPPVERSAVQNQKTNSPAIQGSAVTPTPAVQGQLPRPGQPAAQGQAVRPSPYSGVIVREPQYYQGGVLHDVKNGTLLRPSPYPNPRDPAQNPAVDLMTRRPRGVVLWSWDF